MVLTWGSETFTLLNRIEPASWWAESRSHIGPCSFVWGSRQAPLFSTERWLFFVLVKIPKQSQNLYINSWSTLHLAQGGRVGFSQVKELADPSSLASRTLWQHYFFWEVAWTYRLFNKISISVSAVFSDPQCHFHNANWRQTLLSYLETGMAEKTEQGSSHIDVTHSQFLIMGILVTGGENPTLLD